MQCSRGSSRFLKSPWSTDRTLGLCMLEVILLFKDHLLECRGECTRTRRMRLSRNLWTSWRTKRWEQQQAETVIWIVFRPAWHTCIGKNPPLLFSVSSWTSQWYPEPCTLYKANWYQNAHIFQVEGLVTSLALCGTLDDQWRSIDAHLLRSNWQMVTRIEFLEGIVLKVWCCRIKLNIIWFILKFVTWLLSFTWTLLGQLVFMLRSSWWKHFSWSSRSGRNIKVWWTWPVGGLVKVLGWWGIKKLWVEVSFKYMIWWVNTM